MSFELVVKNGQTFALVPVRKYEHVLAEMELQNDIRLMESALARIDSGDDEIIPISITVRRLNGESTLKIWREFREMTQEKLAEVSGVSRGMIANIESGRKQPGIGSLKKLARALNCDIGNLV